MSTSATVNHSRQPGQQPLGVDARRRQDDPVHGQDGKARVLHLYDHHHQEVAWVRRRRLSPRYRAAAWRTRAPSGNGGGRRRYRGCFPRRTLPSSQTKLSSDTPQTSWATPSAVWNCASGNRSISASMGSLSFSARVGIERLYDVQVGPGVLEQLHAVRQRLGHYVLVRHDATRRELLDPDPAR